VTILLSAGSALAAGAVAFWLDGAIARRATKVPFSAVDPPSGGYADEAVLAVSTVTRVRVRFIPRRPVAVAALAAATAAVQASVTGSSWLLPPQLVLITALVALAAGDYEWLLLPRWPVWWTTAGVGATIVAGAAATGAWHRAGVAVFASAILSGSCAVISLLNPRWLGFGDVRLAVPIGLVLAWSGGGPELLGGVFLTSVISGVAAFLLLASRRMKAGGAIPFGVMLAVGTIARLLVS
jgi:leader peptidase (prepilin peptidase) / N-methyltransferase